MNGPTIERGKTRCPSPLRGDSFIASLNGLGGGLLAGLVMTDAILALSGGFEIIAAAKSSFFTGNNGPTKFATRFGDRLRSLTGVFAPLNSSSSELPGEENFAT